MSNTKLDELLVDQPEDVQAEIIRINTDARPISLQIALLIPVLAGLIGFVNALRMRRVAAREPSPPAGGARPGAAMA